MSEKQRNVWLVVLAVAASAVVFFSLGLTAARAFGFMRKNVVIESIGAETTTSATVHEMIDLNTATVEDLMQLDGLGEKTAQSIIDYRESIGGFQFVEQLLYVSGIGETKYNRWIPYMCVNGVGINGVTASGSTITSMPTTVASDVVDSHDDVASATTTTTTIALITTTTSGLSMTVSETIRSTITATAPTTTAVAKWPLDLNAATVEELMQIDGIGEKTAQNILAYRDRIGGFTSVKQLLEVDGIGKTKFEKWSSYFAVNGVTKTSSTTGTTTVATVTTTATASTTMAVAKWPLDLNTATVEELMQIDGIGEKTAQNILAYRDRIGGFTSVEELLEVDGIGKTKFEKWSTYFAVNGVTKTCSTTGATTVATVTTTATAPTTTVVAKWPLDLNAVTVDELMLIDGIGEKTAQNILAYRDRIGGFTSVEQLLEVDGIGKTKFEKWSTYFAVNGVTMTGSTDSTSTVTAMATTSTAFNKTVELNTATVEELMQIDGIGEKTAQSIIAYRDQIGGFSSIEQLLEIDGIGEAKLNKWYPYFTVNGQSQTRTTTRKSTTTTVIGTTVPFAGVMNLNLVTVEDLMQIDSIGEKLAERIVRYRESIGGFTSMEQLLDVEGIGASRYEILCKYVTLEEE